VALVETGHTKPEDFIGRSVRAVLFDLGNTLVSYYAAADFAPILRKCLHDCIGVLAPHKPIDEDELLQRALTLNVERVDYAVWPLAERLGILFGDAASDSATRERLTTAFLEPIFATAIVDPAALILLASLRARGLRTAIVSNTPWGSPAQAWRAELARHNLLAAVDAAVFCTDVGYRKPHPAPFERALSLLGVRPAEAVFVGDDPRWDVAGAQRAGLRPILVAPRRIEGIPETIPVAVTLGQVLDYLPGVAARYFGPSPQ
jgi:HAD superfamily hydrolase (TIGR01509 family)